MRILLATNTPSLAEKKVYSKELVRGGWIKSLQYELLKRNMVQLGVSFLADRESSFELNSCKYFALKRKSNNKLKRFLRRKLHLAYNELDIDRFKKIIETFNPDVIHILGTENEFGLIQKYINKPVVISLQGNLTICSYKYYSGLSELEVKRNISLIKRLINITIIDHCYIMKQKSKYEREILSYTRHIIGRTLWDQRITKVFAPEAVYYHNDEMLRKGFYKNVWKPKKFDTIKIFTTTGNSNYKGFETILDTSYILMRNKIKFEWYIAGLEKRSEIVEIVKKSRNQEVDKLNIKLLGNLKEKDLISELLSSQLYIQVSHIENSSNSLCEAMILGMPIIATNAGGTSSLMTDNKEGILVQDGDPYVLSGAILEANENYNDLIKFGKRARITTIKRHNPSKIIDELIEIYRKVILNN
jgi:glycosyltransferase involved in cell wall biosynthesis